MIEFTFTSQATPERVLASIREDLREWRESVIPRALWDGGVLQVVGDVEPPRFRLWYDRRWKRGKGGDPLELRGEVTAEPEGGSRVRGRCGKSAGRWWGAGIFAALGLWVAFGGAGFSNASPVFVLAGILALVDYFRLRPGAAADDPEARYLVERVEAAVRRTTAEVASSGSAPSLPAN